MERTEALNADFRDLLVAFAQEQVEFLLVGAFALALHGVPRATGDLDILIRPSPDNARRAWRALVQFGAPVEAAGLSSADLERPDMVYQIGLPPRRIDILTAISGVPFEEAWATRETLMLEGFEVCYLAREALIRNKRATGRAKDLADIEALAGPRPPS